MLRKLRIFSSISLFLLITVYFLDFSGVLPTAWHVLGMIQFLPALLAFNWVILLVLVVLTAIFGRVYCSSICPMGVYEDVVTWLRERTVSKKKRKRYQFLQPLTWLRWGFVGLTLLAFLVGGAFLVGLLDPYSAFGRMTVHLFKPAYLAGNNLLTAIFTSFGYHPFYKVSIYVLSLSSALIALVTMLTIGFMAWRNGRIYCNTVCPVGTVLGAISKYSLYQIRFDHEKCSHCSQCARNCKANCIDAKNMVVDASRCINCFNCVEVCSEGALHYRLPYTKVKTEVTAKPRRQFLSTLALTTLAAGRLMADTVLRLGPKKQVGRQQAIMPPGAWNIEHFAQHCTSCHLCISKCPSHVIKPAFLEYGIGGMMQPMMYFDHQFCNYDCTVCSEVCPTGALQPLTKEQKHETQIGVVQLHLENCIVYTDETSCGACSEHCPTQAVSMIPYKDSLTIPFIRQEICVGCGGCEFICPSLPWKAIFVEGRERHTTVYIEKDKKQAIEIDGFGF